MEPVPLDPVIHQTKRLQILALLYRNRQASFTTIRDSLDLTGGNLASHVDKLEETGYVEGGRVLRGGKFEKIYRITAEGAEAFEAYVARLTGLLDASGALEQVLAPEE